MKKGGGLANYVKDKKGVSAIVATLIIILLVIVVTGVVWVVVRDIFKRGAEQIEISEKCRMIEFSDIIVSEENGGVYKITFTRTSAGTSDPVAGFKITLLNETHNSELLDFDKELKRLETKSKQFEANIFNSSKMKYTAYFHDESGKEQLCKTTDTFIIREGGGISDGNGGNGGNGDNGGNGNGDGGDGENGNGEPSIQCDGEWNQTAYEEGVYECDGEEVYGCNLYTCLCETGFKPNGDGTCNLEPPVNEGTINSVWNNIFFDSNDLPKDYSVSSYIGMYVNFSNSAEFSCFHINFADYISENNMSYIRVDDSPPVGIPNINVGENYHIWEAANCGA